MPRSVATIETLVTNLTSLLNNDLYLGALTTAGITESVCFDCNLWNNGYTDDTGNVIIAPIKTTLLTYLNSAKTELETIIADASVTDYGFKTQVQRFLDAINDLITKITAIQCTTATCDINIMPDFLAHLVVTLIQLIENLEYLNGLMSFYEYCDCLGSSLFSLFMGKFINGITEFQGYLGDWNSIVMVFFQLNATSGRDYVASYMPKSTIQVPTFNPQMSHACVPCPCPRPRQSVQVQRQYVNGGCSPCGGCVNYPC